MRFGICVGVDAITAAAEAGFDYVEMGAPLLYPDKDEAAFAELRRQVEKAPIRVEAYNVFLPGTVKVTGPTVDLKAVEAHMRVVLRRARLTGASIMVFGSGGARKTEPGFPVDKAWEQLARAARLAAELAAQNEMTVVMEPLRPGACSFFTQVGQGIDFVDKVNHPRLQLLADLFHVHYAGEPLENVARAGRRLAHTHLATPSVPPLPKAEAAFDFPGYFAALARAGYEGRMTVEDNPGLLRDVKPPYTPVFRAIRECLDTCRTRRP